MAEKPMTISLTNLLKYISLMSPLLLIFFMVTVSIFNNVLIKGLLFSFGVVIITFLNYLLKNTLKEKQSSIASTMCNLLPEPFTLYSDGNIFSSPSLNSTVIAYTASYLIFPMKLNNQLNPSLATFLLALLGVNAMVELQDKCTSVGGIMLGVVVGVLFGIIYYSVIALSGNKDLAYFSEVLSNDVKCGKPSEQRFKCVTYYRSTQKPVD
jgi:hypothetical protein